METSLLSTVVLPIGLAIIMLGLGLSLTVADFRRAATARRAVLLLSPTSPNGTSGAP